MGNNIDFYCYADVYIRLDSKPFPSEHTSRAIFLDYNLELKFIFLLGEALCEFSQSEEFIYPGEIIAEYSNVDKAGYQKIINQWEIILIDLLNTNNLKKEYCIIMPDSYVDWLHYHEDKQYREIGETLKLFSSVVALKASSLYEDVLGELMQNLPNDLCQRKNFLIILFSVILNPDSLFVKHLSDRLKDTSIDLCAIVNGWGALPSCQCDVFGFYNLEVKTGLPGWEIPHRFSDGLVRVRRDDVWGYVNRTGCDVIPCMFEDAHDFLEGLAAVKKDGKWGYVDRTGCDVIPYIFEDAQNFSEGLAMVEKNGKWGCVDAKGKTIVPCKYDEEFYFFGDLAVVVRNGKYGYVNRNGQEVIKCHYYYAYDFSEGFGCVCLNSGRTEWCYINKYGYKVFNCNWNFDEVMNNAYFTNGIAPVYLNGRYGFINKNGIMVIPCVYEDFYAGTNDDNLICVQLDGKWGCINKENQKVIPFIYEERFDFNEGLASVNYKGKFGFVNKNGDVVIPYVYDCCYIYNLMTYKFLDGLAMVRKNGKWGYIDCLGNVIIPFVFNDVSLFCEDMAQVRFEEDMDYIYINKKWFVKK